MRIVTRLGTSFTVHSLGTTVLGEVNVLIIASGRGQCWLVLTDVICGWEFADLILSPHQNNNRSLYNKLIFWKRTQSRGASCHMHSQDIYEIKDCISDTVKKFNIPKITIDLTGQYWLRRKVCGFLHWISKLIIFKF